MIELSAAMVGYVNAVDAMIAGHHGVFGRLDTFDDDRQFATLPKPLDLWPAQHGLIALRCGVCGRPHHGAFGDVALAPAVDRNINSEREGVISGRHGAVDDVLDPGVVAAYVKLKYFHSLCSGRSHFEARLRYRADHLRHTGGASRAGDGG